MRALARVALGALLLTAFLTLGTAVPAVAVPPPPADLRVEGGEDWRTINRFELTWSEPVAGTGVEAVVYRLLRTDGSVAAGPTRSLIPPHWIYPLSVPVPGRYTAEVWFEDGLRQAGPPSTVTLRFDDVRPKPVAAVSAPAWIGRAALPRAIRIGAPTAPFPPSGIRGYAVSIDQASQGAPCEDQFTCTDGETDLRGGVADDGFWVVDLPEGTNYMHVVAVSGSGVRSTAVTHSPLRVDKTDPVTRLEGTPVGWANGAVNLTAVATDTGSGMAPEGGSSVQPFTAIRVDGGTPKIAAGDVVGASLFESGVHVVERYARDAAGNVNDGATANGRQNREPEIEVIRIDRDSPEVEFSAAQDPSDPERIEATVFDSLSGPSPWRGSIGLRPAGSGDAFQALPTTVVDGRLSARWSSDDYPAGTYEFRATGFDQAGNATSTTERIGGTGMLLASPLKTSTTLEAGLAVRRRHGRRKTVLRRSIPFGRRARLTGRLVSTAPIGGQPIEIVEVFGEGEAPRERVSTVATDADGRFALRLPAGPDRSIAARFRGSRTLSRASSATIDLRVRSSVRMRVSAASAAVGGRPVIFSGVVRAGRGEIPAEGKAVALQFRLPGLPWTDFRTVRTDRRGRFRQAYRFADDDSRGVRFRFRAQVTPEPGWPYEPGCSRPVTVRGK